MSNRKTEPNMPEDPREDPEPVAAGADADTPATDDRDDLMRRLQRLGADYANYQKRAQREKAEDRARAQFDVIQALLPILDDMERALATAREDHGQDDPLLVGMQLVHDKALELLGSFGLKGIDAVGRPFDPDVHAAVMRQPTAEHPPQTVVRELRKGYVLKDRTIRPSSVIVSVEPEDPRQEPQGDQCPDQPES